ncbi:hypothetical protein BCR34DRAFT_446561, partial [Clohesyomyces aquaticus]
VLISFFMSAFITCVAIFWGYFTDSLPTSVLSETDMAVIERYQASGFAKAVPPGLRRYWLKIKVFALRRKKDYRASPSPNREQRVAALTRFVLALSDQQLVTGLAVLIAAIANRCNLNVLELRIAYCLAYFSATTHLATLEVLR